MPHHQNWTRAIREAISPLAPYEPSPLPPPAPVPVSHVEALRAVLQGHLRVMTLEEMVSYLPGRTAEQVRAALVVLLNEDGSGVVRYGQGLYGWKACE